LSTPVTSTTTRATVTTTSPSVENGYYATN